MKLKIIQLLLIINLVYSNINGQNSCLGLQPVFFGGTIYCNSLPYKLVFYDGFDGNSINTNKWYTYSPTYPNNDDQSLFSRTHDTNTTPATFKELQVYKDQNIVVSNGTVKLRAKNETSTWFGVTKNFTSGYLQAITPFKYGKIEVRLKLPTGSGFWPAVWLWGRGVNSSSIDAMHEIDIIEHCGEEPSKHHITYHYQNNTAGCKKTQSSFSYNSVDFTNGFHTLVCEFNPQFIKVFCDGSLVRYEPVLRTITNKLTQCGDNLGNGTYLFSNYTPSVYQSLIINLAMCSANSSYCNSINSSTPIPADMEIDYVKVYQQSIQPGLSNLCNTSITGDNIICDLNNHTYLYPGANEIDHWEAPNLSIISSSSNSVTIKSTNSTFNGIKTIKAVFKANQPCPELFKSFDVWFGKPNIHPVVTDLNCQVEICPNVLPVFSNINWSTTKMNTTTNHIGNTCKYINGSTTAPINYSFLISATNACGISSYSDIGSKAKCSFKPQISIILSPNPVNSNNLSINMKEYSSNSVYKLSIVSIQNTNDKIETTFFGQEKIIIDISKLNSGIYSLTISTNDFEPYMQKIQIIK